MKKLPPLPKMTPDFSAAEKKIGYTFKNKSLLITCFTHSSYVNEHVGFTSNERLEFLGDAVMELVCSESAYLSGGDEGEMTERRGRYVSDENLREVVLSLGLDKFLLFSGGKSNLGKKAIPSLLEAIIGGVYLDGGYDAARDFILKYVTDGEHINYVGRAQEYFQGIGGALPQYRLLSVDGPADDVTFTVQANTEIGNFTGKGKTKKAARMEAARRLCLAIYK